MYAIEVKNVSKIYRLYRKPFDRLKEALLRKPLHQPFESLRDVSLVVPFGETMGIIGENGAGKSTLLKILAGTLTPSSGEVITRGRVAALLELGAGFDPEFTGQQNIYLNASLQGLSESEIKEKEPAIIDFAELGQFIDRPLKTYSSGMVVRLAFSVATSVDPDVLIVDEALSVGDQKFQQKCIDRMMGFRKAGKTIIVCSHSMYLINELCAQTMWLANGRVCSHGKTSSVISEYLGYLEEGSKKDDTAIDPAPLESSSLPDIMIEDLRLLDDKGRPLERIEQFQPVVFQVRTRRIGPPLKGHLGVGLVRPDGQLIFLASTRSFGLEPVEFFGEKVIELVIPSIPLVGGSYRAKAVVTDQHTFRVIHELDTAPYLVESDHPEFGMFWMEHQWRFPVLRFPIEDDNN